MPSTAASTLTAMFPAGRASTAASSPMPSTNALRSSARGANRCRRYAMRSNSSMPSQPLLGMRRGQATADIHDRAWNASLPPRAANVICVSSYVIFLSAVGQLQSMCVESAEFVLHRGACLITFLREHGSIRGALPGADHMALPCGIPTHSRCHLDECGGLDE